jgi:tyrosine-protein phosphatase
VEDFRMFDKAKSWIQPRNMPSASARRLYEDQIPSFMSVFDLDAETMADRDTVTVVDPKLVGVESPKEHSLANPSEHHQLHPTGPPTDPTHRHHDSTSTQMSESADSSPTTTMSTTDSSPLSDPSPSSSPDSPINILPLSNFTSAPFGLQTTTLSVPDAPILERPMTSPSPRRLRNMKNLSIQAPTITSPGGQTVLSEPCSPAFIKPNIPAMKRKPSMLSLKTSTSDLITKRTLEVPPSPGMPPILQRRALKHSTSSPQMFPSLKSSTFGPTGGMTFPKVLERNENGLSEMLRPMKSSMKPTFDAAITEESSSPIKMQMANRADDEPYYDSGDKEDQKSPGYPQGPIAIYGDNVYLYLEPSAEEAAKFDVVINVAREVKNPFDVMQTKFRFRELSPIPDSALCGPDFDTALDQRNDKPAETPTTPKANSFGRPEYIHMPWDHNTDIAPDLLRLCETIEDRTKEGKKVLIHCQQGASRSASLIIAYGLYQKPELSVNDAYYAAQAKSRWISPNMKLMYSLQDFQKENFKRRMPSTSTFRPRAGRSPTKHRLTLSVDAIDISPNEPQTAPLPGEEESRNNTGDSSPHSRLRGNSTPGRPAISPGPASAPMVFSWSEKEKEQTARPTSQFLSPFNPSDLPKRPKTGHSGAGPLSTGEPWAKKPAPSGLDLSDTFGFRSLRIDPQPFDTAPKEPVSLGGFNMMALPPQNSLADTYPDDDALMSPRAEVMTNNPLHSVPEVNGMRFAEAPQAASESLFSPRMTAFTRDSFLAFGRPRQVVDPRSPPTKGEAPIIRSIDDLL